jgi:hypothetical protein
MHVPVKFPIALKFLEIAMFSIRVPLWYSITAKNSSQVGVSLHRCVSSPTAISEGFNIRRHTPKYLTSSLIELFYLPVAYDDSTTHYYTRA